jgi:hypothetical protein
MTTFLFLVGYALFFLSVLALLFFLKNRSRQDRTPFPENTRLLRGPGESLRRKMLQLDDKITDSLLVGVLVPAFALGVIIFIASQCEGWIQLVLAGLGVVSFIVLIIAMARRSLAIIERRRNTNLGYFGERIVAEHLEPLKAAGHKVLHDVPVGDPPAGSTTPPFNLDHVVVGPAGIFAIETKTRRKGRARVGFMAHEIIYDGRALSYPWGEDRYGLDQALRQAEWLCTHLERQLGRTVPVYPLLVFPGWMIIRKAAGAVNVLNPRELPAAIMPSGSLTPALDSATIDLIARQLEARCRDVEL